MECIKNCCKRFMKKRGNETEDIAVQLPIQEDYLLSKMPPDGKEVPFVLPSLKASYVQPGVSTLSNLEYGLPGPARCTYAQRKAELLAPSSAPFAYSSESNLHSVPVTPSPDRGSLGLNPGVIGTSKSYLDVNERLSRSMSELSDSQGPHKKSFDFMPSVLSTPSSNSLKSSTESFSAPVGDLGWLCVRLNYKEEAEQVWITLVQCSQLNLKVTQKSKIRIKGVITLPKPVQFHSSIKEYSQNAFFMETFVFALSLESLRCSSLLLKLQTQGAKRRTRAVCVLSLRQLGPKETEQWLPLRAPGKSSGQGCELHVATCFQPVCRRIQVRVLAAQNLPACSSPLPLAYMVSVELHGADGLLSKKKTPALKATKGQCQWADTFYLDLDARDPAECALSFKLFSCGSIKRKQCVGQVHVRLAGSTREGAEQWKDTVDHPEKVVSAWHAVT